MYNIFVQEFELWLILFRVILVTNTFGSKRAEKEERRIHIWITTSGMMENFFQMEQEFHLTTG